MNIGIIGFGFVGKAIKLGFGEYCKIFINDPKITGNSKKEVVENCDFIFVAVPTPYSVKNKRTDTSIIDGVMNELNEEAFSVGKMPVIIVKSAIIPSQINKWVNNYVNLDIVISPEYLTERTYKHDFVNQKVMILGGNKSSCDAVAKLFEQYSICNKACKIGYCTAEEAGLIKYMENSFLATKVIFHNQMKVFYDKYFGTNDNEKYNKLMELFYLDERMGVLPFKYKVPGPDGDFGYGGKCLPKDVNVIIGEAKEYGVDLSLLSKVNEINDEIRTNRDWEKIEGAVS